MSSYSLIIEKEHIKIFKNKNKFKLEINFEVEPDCDIIEKFKNDEIYKIIKALNKDLIEYLNVTKVNDEISDITLVINNFDDSKDSTNNEKNYLSLFLESSVLSKLFNTNVISDISSLCLLTFKYSI